MHEIEKAKSYDYVFIDEPESSFDNEFLMSDIAKMINDIAVRSTVFLVTHNNTLGVSIHPDRVLYAAKDGDGYRLYSGDLKSTELKTYDGESFNRANALMLTMEAGRPAYDDRKDYYETA